MNINFVPVYAVGVSSSLLLYHQKMRILLPDAFGILLSIFISISPLKSCFWQEAAVTNVFTKFIVIWKEGDRLSTD